MALNHYVNLIFASLKGRRRVESGRHTLDYLPQSGPPSQQKSMRWSCQKPVGQAAREMARAAAAHCCKQALKYIPTGGALEVWRHCGRGPLGPEQSSWLMNQLGNPIYCNKQQKNKASTAAQMLHSYPLFRSPAFLPLNLATTVRATRCLSRATALF